MRISIVSLIYRSPAYADWVHYSVHKYTPLIASGEAEFFFVANDPTPQLIRHLRKNSYGYHLNVNPRRSPEDLFALGIGKPEYIHRVYRGWNWAILSASREIVVLVNSDNFFSPDWLENLLKHSHPQRIVCSQLVERNHPQHGLFPTALQGEFGDHPSNFDERAFLTFCHSHRSTKLVSGGAYMPCMFYRDVAIKVGLYPEGNLAGNSFDEVAECGYGDQVFFDKLAGAGVEHVTAMDSLVYHTKEGESDCGESS